MPERRNAAIRRRIEKALAENNAERERLDKALLHLDTGITSSPGSPLRPDKPKPRKRRRAKRAPKGQRRQQFLDAVKGKPGITVTQIAKKLGVSPPNSLYALAKRLVKEGLVTKSGSGYKLKAQKSSQSKPPRKKKKPPAKKPRAAKKSK